MSSPACPACGRPLMTFVEFMRAVDPNTIATCSTCGARSRRSRAAWFLLVAAGVLFAALAVGLSRTDLQPWMVVTVLAGVLPIWFVTVKFIGWTAVSWRVIREL